MIAAAICKFSKETVQLIPTLNNLSWKKMSLRERLEDALCVYKSTRFIRVRNKKLVTIYYVAILVVLLYIILGTIWYSKGYQKTDPVTGTTSVKLKGTGSVNGSIGSTEGTVFDAMDLVVPSVEEDAFFITTSS